MKDMTEGSVTRHLLEFLYWVGHGQDPSTAVRNRYEDHRLTRMALR